MARGLRALGARGSRVLDGIVLSSIESRAL